MERKPIIDNPDEVQAKLAGLLAGTKYRVHIKPTTEVGTGEK